MYAIKMLKDYQPHWKSKILTKNSIYRIDSIYGKEETALSLIYKKCAIEVKQAKGLKVETARISEPVLFEQKKVRPKKQYIQKRNENNKKIEDILEELNG